MRQLVITAMLGVMVGVFIGITSTKVTHLCFYFVLERFEFHS
jgi:hypothetical protein